MTRPAQGPAGPPAVADPRPRVERSQDGWMLVGGRCASCDYPLAATARRCPACRADAVEPARFGPEGAVWSATVVRVDAAGRTAPYALVYVDLDDGPRILAHADRAPSIGARVRLAGATVDGDPLVEPVG
jgi:uncharacterized protein